METVEIGRIGQWTVLVRPWPNYGEDSLWWDIRVKHDHSKGAYWIGWNGNRFANGKSLDSMGKNPGLADDVRQILESWHKSQDRRAA